MTGSGIVDTHCHIGPEPGFLERLRAACEELGIEKVCAQTSGDERGFDNDRPLRAAEALGGLVWPIYTFVPGRNRAEEIASLRPRGFRGVKFIVPAAEYDSREFDPIYEAVAAEGLPAIFHTGIVARVGFERWTDVSCDRMRPVRLDTLARRFPTLEIVMCHLGAPWYDEALMVLRVNRGIRFDITSGSGWEPKGMGEEWFRRAFWWPGAADAMVFGTDVPPERMAWAVGVYRRAMDWLGLDAAARERVWRLNALRLFGER